jgi:DNA repair protein RadC
LALRDDDPGSRRSRLRLSERRTAEATTEKPRERLFSQGLNALSDAELVALTLRTGSNGAGAVDVANTLLARHGGLPGLARSDLRELTSVRGIGRTKAASLFAAIELGRRISRRRLREGDAVRGPEDVFRHFYARLRSAAQEHFCVLLLDGRHRILGEEVVSLGTLTASLVHPREVFRPALRASAAALVLVHNHPSGDPEPSPEDRSVTERLARAGELLGIPILDHVVVAERGFRSLREAGCLGEAPRPREGAAKASPASGR